MSSSPAPARGGRLLVLLAFVLLALNLRPAAVSVGPVLAEITAGLGMSNAVAGVLTSLPVVAFAIFGASAPWAARLFGLHRSLLLSLALLVVGLGGRAMTDSVLLFMLLSLVALAGMATGNVLLPSLVRLHFPDRIGLATALYSTALAIGLTCAFLLTVPAAQAFGGWRQGLGLWAVVGLVAALPWALMVAHDRRLGSSRAQVSLRAVARTPIGMMMALTFGLQSLQAYTIFGWFAQLWRDSGFSATTAGALVGLLAGVSIPLSLWLPRAAARRTDQRGIVLAVMACYPVGYLGLILYPQQLAVLWALLVGVGACTFPLVLSLIALRSRTPEGTAALSGFTQAAGYLLAAVGPFTVGVLYDATGGWTWPLVLLLAVLVPQLVTTLYVARPGHVEDQIRPA